MLRSLSKKILRRSYFNRQACSSIMRKPPLFQKRTKVDADSSKLFTAEELANPLETVYKRMANAPPGSPAAIVFETLLRAGKIELKKQVKQQKITGQDLTKVPMTFESMPFSDMPLESSKWSNSLALQLVVFDHHKEVCPVITKEDLEWVPIARKIIYDPIIGNLKARSVDEWLQQFKKVQIHFSNSIAIDVMRAHTFLSTVKTMLMKPRRKFNQITFADYLLAVTHLGSGPVRAQRDHKCSVETANGSTVTSKYDLAMTFFSIFAQNSEAALAASANLPSHIPAFIQIRQNLHLDGPLAADMIIQAAKNFTVYKIEEELKNKLSRGDKPLSLISMPSTVRSGSTFFSYAIVICHKKIRVYKGEFSTKFLEQFTTKGSTDGPIPKGIIREYDSPSGNGFNVMDIDDLRPLFNLLSSLHLSYYKPYYLER